MKILFIVGTKRGYLALKVAMEQGVEVCGVISLKQDAHESERFEDCIRGLASDAGIPCYETKWMKEQDYAEIVKKELKPDAAFVVGARIMIPESICQTIPRGVFAAHDSMLPQYRGFAPLNWAILNGEASTGVTIFYLDKKVDAGDIVAQESVDIGPDDTASKVYERVCQVTIDLILSSIEHLESGDLFRTKQDESLATYTCSRVPADGLIDWSLPTLEIYNLIRGLTYPYPGAFTFLNRNKLYVWESRPVSDAPRYAGRIPGRVVGIENFSGTVDVLTGDGILRLAVVELAEKERCPAADVIRSIRDTLGV
jgi:methionyl-tRNA formyltransferase